MNEIPSDRIAKVPVSATLEMAAKTRELKKQGIDIIGLSLGEPNFNTPDFIKEAAIEAIDNNYSTYSPVDGYYDLKEAICEKFKRDNNLKYRPSQIVVSTGAKQAISNVVYSLINPGDEVLMPSPYWVSYKAMVSLAQGVTIELPTNIDNDFKITPEQLEIYIKPKTRLIFLNSPNNPSGTVYTEQEYRKLATVLEKYPNIFVISDEIYEHIIYSGRSFSFASIESMFERTITVNGLSKAFAMTGWRIGYIGAPEWIAKACAKMQGQITSGANSIAQRAAIAAVNAPLSKIKYMVDSFKERRALILKLLSNIEGFKVRMPQGAFYVLPDVSYFFGMQIKGHLIKNASDFALFLLGQAKVATVTGDAFGAPNNIRFSYAASKEEIIEALSRIKKALIY